jgi:hypothetical protein
MLWLSPVGWDPRACAALKARYGESAIAVYPAGEATSAVEPTLSAIYWAVAGRPPEQEELDANEIIWPGIDFDRERSPLDERLLAICAQIVRGEILLSLHVAGIHYTGEEIIGHHLRQYSELEYSLQPSGERRPGGSWEIRIDSSHARSYAFDVLIEDGRKRALSEAHRGFLFWLEELLYEPRYFRDPSEALKERELTSWGTT